MTEAKRLHQKLFILVENELHPSMSQYRGVIAASHVYLPGGVVSSCQSVLDLLRALQNHGKIRVGDYTVLKEILEDSRMIALKCKVEDQEKVIKRALIDERRLAGQEPTVSLGRLPERFDLSSMGRESSRQRHHETVAKQPESAFDVPDGRPRDETVAKQPQSALWGSLPYELRVETGDNIYKSSKIFRIVQLSDACKDWRSLGRELGLEDAVFDVISHDFNQQLREQCYQMLRTWLQESGKSATPKALITALRNLHHNKAAEEIIEYFTDRPLEL